MKRQIQTLTTLLLMAGILLAGCDGCGQKSDTTQRDVSPIVITRGSGTQTPKTIPEPEHVPEPVVEAPKPILPLTREELPEQLPIPITPLNKDIWDALLLESEIDPELLESLLPDTKEKALQIWINLSRKGAGKSNKYAFRKALWHKMTELYPNDPEVLWQYTKSLFPHKDASRAEKMAYIASWERLKKLNDAQDVHPASELRKTSGLSQLYIDVGEYDKAIQNIREQNKWLRALKAAGGANKTMYYGLMRSPTVAIQLKREKEEREHIENLKNLKDDR